MTVKEVKKMFESKYADIEFYKLNSKKQTFHRDYIDSMDEEEVADDMEVIDYELMDEEDYSSSTGIYSETDFSEWFDNKDAKILVVIVNTDSATFGKEVKKWRKNAMMSQQAMADELKMPKRTIENWEQGSRVPADWAAKLVIEKLMRLAEANIEKRAKIRMDHMKSDEEGRRPAGSWAVIGITKQGDEFIQLYSSMEEAINAADDDYYYDITVGYIICNQTEKGLEAFYCDRDGNTESDFDSIEF